MKYLYIALLVILVAGVTILSIPFSLLFFQQAKEASRRAEVSAHLAEIGEALAQYHEQHPDPFAGLPFNETRSDAIRRASNILSQQLDIPENLLPVDQWQAFVNLEDNSIKVSGKSPTQDPDPLKLVDFEIVFTRRMIGEDVVWFAEHLTLNGQQILENKQLDIFDRSKPADNPDQKTTVGEDDSR